jgi:hypothetical protein
MTENKKIDWDYFLALLASILGISAISFVIIGYILIKIGII